jgi:hypothetical protein
MFRVFSLYPFFFYLYLYLLSNTEREKKRQTREREITRPFEWIDSAQSSLGFSYFYFVRSFRLLAKELAKVESNWKHVRYTSICKHAFYMYIYIYIYTTKKGEHWRWFKGRTPPWIVEDGTKWEETNTNDWRGKWLEEENQIFCCFFYSVPRIEQQKCCTATTSWPTQRK